MASYTYNKAGSATGTLPDKIVSGDTLRFNVTNSKVDTRYLGTMLTYTFPFDCTVQIDVAGARGGKGNGADTETVCHGKGARIKGECSFKEGDTLLMCIGQAGTDSGVSTRDGSTGAGGGGTFVVQKTTSGDIYEGAGVGNGWRVTPLIISAGGNGSRDIGYSGKGTVYHGLASEGSRPPSYSSYSGGGYSTQYYMNDGTNGDCFLSGAFGGSDAFERSTSISYAGFGGGGSNRDDEEGGGGGGYYGGTLKSSATSFVASNVKAISRKDGTNNGQGFVIITFVEVIGAKTLNARCKVGGQIKNVNNMYVKVEGNWREVFDIRFKQEGNWISP